MKYRVFPSTGWSVSALSLGCWSFGGQWGAIDRPTIEAVLGRAIDAGINFFDTADGYGVGASEEALGRFLTGQRHRVFISTKVGYWAMRQGHRLAYSHPLHVKLCCDASLHRLRTDYIDLYHCHIDQATPGETEVFLAAFADLLQAGKIRAFAVSTNQPDVARGFHRDGRCAAIQFDYSLLNRTAETGLLPWCVAQNLAAIIRGPLAQGMLTGKFTPEAVFSDQVRESWNSGEGRERFLLRLREVEHWRRLAAGRPLAAYALRALLEHPGATTLIPGAKSPAQLNEQLAALDLPWTEADAAFLRAGSTG